MARLITFYLVIHAMSLYTAPACRPQHQGQSLRSHQSRVELLTFVGGPTTSLHRLSAKRVRRRKLPFISDRLQLHGVELTRIRLEGFSCLSDHLTTTYHRSIVYARLTTDLQITLAPGTMESRYVYSTHTLHLDEKTRISNTPLPGFDVITYRVKSDTEHTFIYPCRPGVSGINVKVDVRNDPYMSRPRSDPPSVSRQRQSMLSNYLQR